MDRSSLTWVGDDIYVMHILVETQMQKHRLASMPSENIKIYGLLSTFPTFETATATDQAAGTTVWIYLEHPMSIYF